MRGLLWMGFALACSAQIQDLPVDPKTLKQEAPIESRIAEPERGQGFTVWSASILLAR
jgi:hypothetical protein